MPVNACNCVCPCTGAQPAAKVWLYGTSGSCVVLPYVGFSVIGGVCTWIWNGGIYETPTYTFPVTLYVFYDAHAGQWGSRIDTTTPASGVDETFGDREAVYGGTYPSGTWGPGDFPDETAGGLFPYAQAVPDPSPWQYGDGTNGVPALTPNPPTLNAQTGAIRCVGGYLTSYSDNAAATPGAYQLGSGTWQSGAYPYYPYSLVTLNQNGNGTDGTCP